MIRRPHTRALRPLAARSLSTPDPGPDRVLWRRRASPSPKGVEPRGDHPPLRDAPPSHDPSLSKSRPPCRRSQHPGRACSTTSLEPLYAGSIRCCEIESMWETRFQHAIHAMVGVLVVTPETGEGQLPVPPER